MCNRMHYMLLTVYNGGSGTEVLVTIFGHAILPLTCSTVVYCITRSYIATDASVERLNGGTHSCSTFRATSGIATRHRRLHVSRVTFASKIVEDL